MPKKRHAYPHAKPTADAHPSLNSATSKSATFNTLPSVNEKLSALRIEQRHASKPINDGSSTPLAASGVQNRSLPPALQEILQIPPSLPPRPRPSLTVRGGGSRRSGLAGPPAPGSWLVRPKQKLEQGPQSSRLNPPLDPDHALPGLNVPRTSSLLDMTYKRIAREWEAVSWYEQRNLGALPVRMKEMLLRYLAVYHPCTADLQALQLLFLAQHSKDVDECTETPTTADLSTLMGYTLTFDELKSFFTSTVRKKENNDQVSLSSMPDDDQVPDTWDAAPTIADDRLQIPQTLPAVPPFTTLTQLSLAHPSPTTTWPMLLSLAPHLGLLTHLSLAHWPRPQEHPNSQTAHFTSPLGSIQSSADHYYSAFDGDFSGPATVLRKLSRNLPCLRWLDLRGCWSWIRVLNTVALQQLWHGVWASLHTIVIDQGDKPSVLAKWPLDRSDWDDETKACYGGDDQASGAALRKFQEWCHRERELHRLDHRVNAEISDLLDLFSRKTSSSPSSSNTKSSSRKQQFQGRFFHLQPRLPLLSSHQSLDTSSSSTKPPLILDHTNRTSPIKFLYTTKDKAQEDPEKLRFLDHVSDRMEGNVKQQQSLAQFLDMDPNYGFDVVARSQPARRLDRFRDLRVEEDGRAWGRNSGRSGGVGGGGDDGDGDGEAGERGEVEVDDLVVDLNARKGVGRTGEVW